ncbi:SMC-Scp complex subunit ScpB [Halomonas sp. MCCC 1A17488]|uniref:SMC-Scp complex subunit ScpB n=1 Tax=unclassified Halomonas TaxID=2609666 RepID=UPI0018D24309|nr:MULTISPECIES: SMC-Scp complex subunit ScpB [unclassified Halomonas]MCE8016429.1 SMC-Scp complex subunit ScpB [Halomonas sp. MCCC 1A17488]MCG3239762.1 SMC-Scp complex subunit ScpB [Halomonas sp. MCCC 1A17488]QPP50336.1 SMC-Scp complex subunit ScpB [Halomonas sp. SS10-MC5]
MTAMELPDSLDEILEAALLAAAEPLSLERLEGLFDDHERPRRRSLREALERVAARHDRGAMELIETASGYQLRIRPRLSPWVSRLWDERPQRYSRALLETLALIAYRQPVTRGDIEEVRGVAVSSSIMRTLAERGWIRVVGHRDVPGRPAVYATTRQFLDDFGLKTLDELPPMHELKGMAEPIFEDEAPPPPSTLLAQADEAASGDEEGVGDDGGYDSEDDEEDGEVGAGRIVTEDTLAEATAGTADVAHAGKASDRPGLSFADLEARLAERARTSVDDDGGAGAESTDDEKSDDT